MTVETLTKPDFTGYATRFDIECSDGRTIKHGAFLHQDGQQVPLVWRHQHNTPGNVLGHAMLYHREDGVYTEAFFNETTAGLEAKELVRHGDIKSLSIFASRLKQVGSNVVHGDIGEVSLVYKGANPGAYIQDVNLQHSGDGSDTMIGEAIIFTGEEFSLYHEVAAVDVAKSDDKTDDSSETVSDIVNSMNPKQKTVLYALIAQATPGDVKHEDAPVIAEGTILHDEETDETIDVTEVIESLTETQRGVFDSLVEEASKTVEVSDEVEASAEPLVEAAATTDATSEVTHADVTSDNAQLQHQEGTDHMKYNAFEQNGAAGAATDSRTTLSHDDLVEINTAAKELGSYKKAFEGFILAHADYGITNIDVLFPDARVQSNTPELIARQTEWVSKVLSATKHSPFAKVKTILADLTAEEARAKGYVKGTLKKEEVVVLMQRTTSPTTIYKKQKLDRDDIVDIVDLDVVAWLKWEIRFMLNEEIARAILIGDGRLAGNPDKIKDPAGQIDGIGIRSIAKDHELYAHPVELAANVAPSVMIDEITRARTNYRGSGSPSFYTTDSVLTELLLLKDKMGRRLYETETALAAAIRVKEIVAVEVMEEDPTLIGIIVNLIDYTVGTNKGGEVTMFDDFDIDFNQYKYLMETRLSGALTKPKSALVIRREVGIEAVPAAPTFANNIITIVATTGVDYLIDGVVKTGNVTITESTDVVAEPKAGYYLKALATRNWAFTYTA